MSVQIMCHYSLKVAIFRLGDLIITYFILSPATGFVINSPYAPPTQFEPQITRITQITQIKHFWATVYAVGGPTWVDWIKSA